MSEEKIQQVRPQSFTIKPKGDEILNIDASEDEDGTINIEVGHSPPEDNTTELKEWNKKFKEEQKKMEEKAEEIQKMLKKMQRCAIQVAETHKAVDEIGNDLVKSIDLANEGLARTAYSLIGFSVVTLIVVTIFLWI